MTSNIPLENLNGYIWLNGEFINFSDAKIHVLTHSLHYGGAVFEGEKAVDGKIFRISDHTDRLFLSAVQMGLEINFSKDEIIKASYDLLEKNNLKNAYLRPLAWRSTEALMVKPNNPKYNLMIAAWEPRKPQNTNPINLVLSSWIKPNEKMHPVQCKASSLYSIYTLAIEEAVKLGYDDALMQDEHGNISEATTSNIFFAKDNVLHTPTTRNCLSGITRKTVIECAHKIGLDVIERDIKLDEIGMFDSCFLTGTAMGLKNVRIIDTKEILYHLVNDEIYNSLKSEYQKLLGRI